jgi:hypothetical protein
MFTFLTRLGRLAVGIPILVAVIVIFGASPLSSLPAASKHKDPGACTVAIGAVINGQQRLLITGAGMTPSTKFLEAQTGVQSVWVTTDSTGSSNDQSLYYHGAGTYAISFYYYYWSNNKLVQATETSCSARL